ALPLARILDGRRPAHRLAARVARQPQAQLPLAGGARDRRGGAGLRAGRAVPAGGPHVRDDRLRRGHDRGRLHTRHSRPPADGRLTPAGDGRASRAPQSALRRLRRAPGDPDHRPRRDGLARLVGPDRDDPASRRGGRARRLPLPFRRAHGGRGVESLQGGRHVHGLQRPRPRRAAAREEVLSSRAGADRLRRLPAGPARGSLPRPRRLRPRRLAGDHQTPGEPPRELDRDRRSRAHPGGAAGHPAGAAQERVKRLWRWLIPLAAVPVLALLAYGFRVSPRDIPSPLVGRPAPGFALATLEGAPLDLAAHRGKVVVVNFWASWCYPACYEEAPVLERNWRGYRERGVVVVGVDIQDKREAALKFVGDFGLTFPIAQDLKGTVSVDYGVYGVPETFFVDRRGQIRVKHVGAVTDDVFKTTVDRLLAEPASQ